MGRLFDMFCKKQIKTIDMSTGEFIKFEPVSLWIKAKTLKVDDINGSRNHYDNVKFKVTNKELIINDKDLQYIVYSLEKIIKYFYQPDITPHT